MSSDTGARSKSNFGREFVVGLFFVVGMVLLGVFTIIIKREAWFSDLYPRSAVFDNVSGLSEGDKVMLRGLEVGRVAHLMPVERGSKIQIRMDLTMDLQFHEDYVVEIRTASALGGQVVYLALGDLDKPAIPTDQVLAGTTAGGPFGEITKKVDAIAEKVNGVMDDFRNEKGTLYKLIYEDTLYETTQTTLKSAEDGFKSLNDAGTKVGDAMDQLKKAGETIDKQLADVGKLKDQFGDAADRIGKAGDSLTKAGDSVDKVATNLNAAVADARAGKGTVGKFLTDDTFYEDAKSTMADIRKNVGDFTTKLNDKDSSLGKILNDEGKMYNSVKTAFDSMGSTMDEVNGLVKDVREGNGTIGKLIKNDSLYKEAQETVKEVRGAVTDFREQSPILTFGSFVFGAL